MTKIRSVRLSEDLSRRIDAWIAAQPEPRPSRSEAILRILPQALGKTADAKSPALPPASGRVPASFGAWIGKRRGPGVGEGYGCARRSA
jgi:Arc/MetJ-type ribon-helix-helix transcriptional regulator